MKKSFCIAIIAGIILFLTAAQLLPVTNEGNNPGHVRLVVLLVVDQMRTDYLTRWSEAYSAGVSRLLTNGAVFLNAHHDHAATVTATGHATISTGSIPAHHGIVGNSFYDRKSGTVVHSVHDDATTIVGKPSEGGSSPLRLLRSTMGDWLKEVSPQSKVYSLALKDRPAVLMGGRHSDGVYWYDDETGDFVTSTFYTESLPDWVSEFNRSGAKDIWRDSLWTKVKPTLAYQGEDIVEAEKGGANSAFPHRLVAESDPSDAHYYSGLYDSPFGDALLLRFSWKLFNSEQLGADDIPDLLMVSLSAADLVGHGYGPDSHEIEDYYLRLDGQLGAFLDSLDARVGAGNYLLVFTSDHGVCPLPELAVNQGMSDARRVPPAEFRSDVGNALLGTFADCYDAASLLKPYGSGFMVDSTIAFECGLSIAEVEYQAAAAIAELDYVADVFTFAQLQDTAADDRSHANLFRNTFHPERAFDLEVDFKEGVLMTSYPSGTSHGAAYHYDTDVPIIVFGAGIPPGMYADSVRTVDIAPTIADVLRITPDSDVDGEVLPLTE